MKNLFIGLLIVAAGAGAFFFLRNKKQSSEVRIDKELLVGKWKLQSFQAGKDSGKIFLSGITGPIDSNHHRQYYLPGRIAPRILRRNRDGSPA